MRRNIISAGGIALGLIAGGAQAYQPSPSLKQSCDRVAALNYAAAQMRDEGINEAQAITSIDRLVKNQDDKDSLKVGILTAYEAFSNVPAEEIKTRIYKNCLAANQNDDMKTQTAVAAASGKGENTIAGTWHCQSVKRKTSYTETFRLNGTFTISDQYKSWGTYQFSDGYLIESVQGFQNNEKIEKLSNIIKTKIIFDADGSYKYTDALDNEYRCERG